MVRDLKPREGVIPKKNRPSYRLYQREKEARRIEKAFSEYIPEGKTDKYTFRKKERKGVRFANQNQKLHNTLKEKYQHLVSCKDTNKSILVTFVLFLFILIFVYALWKLCSASKPIQVQINGQTDTQKNTSSKGFNKAMPSDRNQSSTIIYVPILTKFSKTLDNFTKKDRNRTGMTSTTKKPTIRKSTAFTQKMGDSNLPQQYQPYNYVNEYYKYLNMLYNENQYRNLQGNKRYMIPQDYNRENIEGNSLNFNRLTDEGSANIPSGFDFLYLKARTTPKLQTDQANTWYDNSNHYYDQARNIIPINDENSLDHNNDNPYYNSYNPNEVSDRDNQKNPYLYDNNHLQYPGLSKERLTYLGLQDPNVVHDDIGNNQNSIYGNSLISPAHLKYYSQAESNDYNSEDLNQKLSNAGNNEMRETLQQELRTTKPTTKKSTTPTSTPLSSKKPQHIKEITESGSKRAKTEKGNSQKLSINVVINFRGKNITVPVTLNSSDLSTTKTVAGPNITLQSNDSIKSTTPLTTNTTTTPKTTTTLASSTTKMTSKKTTKHAITKPSLLGTAAVAATAATTRRPDDFNWNALPIIKQNFALKHVGPSSIMPLQLTPPGSLTKLMNMLPSTKEGFNILSHTGIKKDRNNYYKTRLIPTPESSTVNTHSPISNFQWEHTYSQSKLPGDMDMAGEIVPQVSELSYADETHKKKLKRRKKTKKRFKQTMSLQKPRHEDAHEMTLVDEDSFENPGTSGYFNEDVINRKVIAKKVKSKKRGKKILTKSKSSHSKTHHQYKPNRLFAHLLSKLKELKKKKNKKIHPTNKKRPKKKKDAKKLRNNKIKKHKKKKKKVYRKNQKQLSKWQKINVKIKDCVLFKHFESTNIVSLRKLAKNHGQNVYEVLLCTLQKQTRRYSCTMKTYKLGGYMYLRRKLKSSSYKFELYICKSSEGMNRLYNTFKDEESNQSQKKGSRRKSHINKIKEREEQTNSIEQWLTKKQNVPRTKSSTRKEKDLGKKKRFFSNKIHGQRRRGDKFSEKKKGRKARSNRRGRKNKIHGQQNSKKRTSINSESKSHHYSNRRILSNKILAKLKKHRKRNKHQKSSLYAEDNDVNKIMNNDDQETENTEQYHARHRFRLPLLRRRFRTQNLKKEHDREEDIHNSHYHKSHKSHKYHKHFSSTKSSYKAHRSDKKENTDDENDEDENNDDKNHDDKNHDDESDDDENNDENDDDIDQTQSTVDSRNVKHKFRKHAVQKLHRRPSHEYPDSVFKELENNNDGNRENIPQHAVRHHQLNKNKHWRNLWKLFQAKQNSVKQKRKRHRKDNRHQLDLSDFVDDLSKRSNDQGDQYNEGEAYSRYRYDKAYKAEMSRKANDMDSKRNFKSRKNDKGNNFQNEEFRERDEDKIDEIEGSYSPLDNENSDILDSKHSRKATSTFGDIGDEEENVGVNSKEQKMNRKHGDPNSKYKIEHTRNKHTLWHKRPRKSLKIHSLKSEKKSDDTRRSYIPTKFFSENYFLKNKKHNRRIRVLQPLTYQKIYNGEGESGDREEDQDIHEYSDNANQSKEQNNAYDYNDDDLKQTSTNLKISKKGKHWKESEPVVIVSSGDYDDDDEDDNDNYSDPSMPDKLVQNHVKTTDHNKMNHNVKFRDNDMFKKFKEDTISEVHPRKKSPLRGRIRDFKKYHHIKQADQRGKYSKNFEMNSDNLISLQAIHKKKKKSSSSGRSRQGHHKKIYHNMFQNLMDMMSNIKEKLNQQQPTTSTIKPLQINSKSTEFPTPVQYQTKPKDYETDENDGRAQSSPTKYTKPRNKEESVKKIVEEMLPVVMKNLHNSNSVSPTFSPLKSLSVSVAHSTKIKQTTPKPHSTHHQVQTTKHPSLSQKKHSIKHLSPTLHHSTSKKTPHVRKTTKHAIHRTTHTPIFKKTTKSRHTLAKLMGIRKGPNGPSRKTIPKPSPTRRHTSHKTVPKSPIKPKHIPTATFKHKTSKRPTKPTPTRHPVPHPVPFRNPKILNMLCFGDSLTAGYYHHGKEFFPYGNRLNMILNQNLRIPTNIKTKGIVGEMTHKQMTTRLPLELGNMTKVDWVILLGGTNDILHVKNFADDQEFLGQLENIWQPRITKDIEKLHQISYNYGAHTMLLTIPENSIELWPGYKLLFNMRKKINNALRHFANQSQGKTVLCDLDKKLPRHSLSSEMESLYWDDHLHLTPAGYNRMADIVYRCLKPYLPPNAMV